MQKITLFDTLSRKIRPLAAADGKQFRYYVCGPTVYGPAHIGNFITFLRFDVLYRTLKVAGARPFYVRNITDVDDKTIAGARAARESLDEFTDRWTKRFHEDCHKLNLLKPDVEPRATQHIREQIKLIDRLIEKDVAYVSQDGSVYFRISRFQDYGKLSHFDPQSLLTQESNSAGGRNLADEYERDSVSDFALWKAWKEEDGPVYWESPYGRGRPGWHLECSAMSMRYLGDTFDLHGGGEDLCFPHHENEIAQSEAASGKPLCNHWMHAVHLLVEGKKMSKSLGNFFTIQDLIDKGYHPMEIRLAMLGGHYRQQFNFTISALDAARAGLRKLRAGVQRWLDVTENHSQEVDKVHDKPLDDFGPWQTAWDALCNDLNTPAALGALFSSLKSVKPTSATGPRYLPALNTILFALGLDPMATADKDTATAMDNIPDDIRNLAESRWMAKQDRNFALADQLRGELAAKGWQVVDRKDGFTLNPEASKL